MSWTGSPRNPFAPNGAAPSFLGYGDFPGSICASVNEEIVHGIPGSRVLREGDLISLDCGAIIPDDAAQAATGRWNTRGWHADAAITVPRRRGRPGAGRALPGHRGRRCGPASTR